VKAEELVQRCGEVVNELKEVMERERLGLIEIEKRLLEFVNAIGSLMLQEVVEAAAEPLLDNRGYVGEEPVRYLDERPVSFRNRFGGVTRRRRRVYRYLNKGGCYYPLDEKLGLDKVYGFSPLLTYLQVLYGGSRPFEESSKLLSAALGFKLCATAVQRNTEEVGAVLSDDPRKVIAARRRATGCATMVVEVDGTTSPQIQEQPGVEGRQALKQPTHWKICNVVTIQKFNRAGQQIDQWAGARYGSGVAFSEHVRQAALTMGQLSADRVAFVADGLPANWQIQMDHFPGAICILDFYHASEHLGRLCDLFKDQKKGRQLFAQWRRMLRDGEVLQVLRDIRSRLHQVSDRSLAVKEYRYFLKNKKRMQYDLYREQDLPIGSGKVEGSCKFIVGKRFKGNGMRWMSRDNQRVLKARLASLNNRLEPHFRPTPKPCSFAVAA
jgi:hypothetical protein